jgi:hypothetical protein
MQLNDESPSADLDRLRELARALAESDPGPASELACALADAVAGVAGRMDALWRLIAAVVETAGLSLPDAKSPPAEFTRALAAPRGTGQQSVRLNIDGREWVAAISQDERPADPAGAWAAIERITKAAGQQEPDDDSPWSPAG